MSVESFLAQDDERKKPRHFNDVADKLLNEKEPNDPRPWKWEEELGEREWKGMETELERDRKNNDWWRFALHASRLHLLDPQRPLPLVPADWEGMETELETNRKKNQWGSFAYLASFMRILAAHKAEVTKQGIEITDTPPEQFDEIPKRPVRRRI